MSSPMIKGENLIQRGMRLQEERKQNPHVIMNEDGLFLQKGWTDIFEDGCGDHVWGHLDNALIINNLSEHERTYDLMHSTKHKVVDCMKVAVDLETANKRQLEMDSAKTAEEKEEAKMGARAICVMQTVLRQKSEDEKYGIE